MAMGVLSPGRIDTAGARIFLGIAAMCLPASLAAELENGQRAAAVIGQSSFTSELSGTSSTLMEDPRYVAVDPATGKLFVSDMTRHRILRFSSVAAASKGAAAEAVLGQPNFSSIFPAASQTGFDTPKGLFVDGEGRLWVADSGNHRVVYFENAANLPSGAPANRRFGQSSFTSSSSGTSDSKMDDPSDVTIDFLGNLWVADTGNHRVLRFEDPTGSFSSEADLVLGQANFTSDNDASGPSGLDFPQAVATRRVFVAVSPTQLSIQVELWVADWGNHRVLKYSNATSLSNGASANVVLGQENFTANDPGSTDDEFNLPSDLAFDGSDLWVSDGDNRRVLRFDSVSSKTTGSPADLAIGASSPSAAPFSFVTPTDRNLYTVYGIAMGPDGSLYTASPFFNRVLRFAPGTPQPDGQVGRKKNQQSGNDIYNFNAAGQNARVRGKVGRRTKVHFTLQNDGPFDDAFLIRGKRGNRKLDARWFETAGKRTNVTAKLTRGAGILRTVEFRRSATFQLQVRATKRAKRTFFLQGISQENGSLDRVIARFAAK
ncbi:MAG: NHL repeat-containing protein [Verrucomicrobiota bacterium]